ncbi:uncharacterized protein PV09_04074 [Verruconis gallopava]|uniref:Uncharacterized protein n=1 Tax=Verruconis gallopava TaxID=253628 RepID=A0A0D2AD79_9PEZI|nr:uncharacterized protein PV09_04074 [Verruconis gallopava]KIW04903.1 hypothetical protein PV09_04074 [Verruconis gallopava]
MGARHNRKRTRSRPRNRLPASTLHRERSLSISSSPSICSDSSVPVLPFQRSAAHWQPQWDHWNDRSLHQAIQKQQREHNEAMAAEAQRLRIFGGEAGDEVSLCAPMLQVVMGLFGGLDYEDP